MRKTLVIKSKERRAEISVVTYTSRYFFCGHLIPGISAGVGHNPCLDPCLLTVISMMPIDCKILIFPYACLLAFL